MGTELLNVANESAKVTKNQVRTLAEMAALTLDQVFFSIHYVSVLFLFFPHCFQFCFWF